VDTGLCYIWRSGSDHWSTPGCTTLGSDREVVPARWRNRLKARVASPGAMGRVASSSSSSSAAGGAPRAVVSDGDVAAATGARTDGRGGLPFLPDLIALGRGGPAASTAGGGSVATVRGKSPFDPDHAHPAATDRAVASDLGLTGIASQRGPGGPANTPRDPTRRGGAFAPPRRRDAGGHHPAPSSAAHRRADADKTELDTTEAEETFSAWAAARAERRRGASPPTDGSAAQMGARTGRHGRSSRGSRRSAERRPETSADTTESLLLMAEMRQELGELRRLRDQIAETAPSAAMPEALPAQARAGPRAAPSASARSAAPTPGWATSPAGGVHAEAHSSDSEADLENTGEPAATMEEFRESIVGVAVRRLRRDQRLERVTDPRFVPLFKTDAYRLFDRKPGFSRTQRAQQRYNRRDLKEMMLTEDRRGDATDRVSVINFLRKLKNSCDALGVAEGAAVYLLQWLVSEAVMVVIRRVVPMGSDTAAVAAQPKFKHIVRELLEEYLDEDVLSDRLRELQYAKQHAWETEGQVGDRFVALNAALGALLDGKELKAVLVQGVGESLRAAARQYNTAGRSFKKLKAHLDREGRSSRALHKTKLAPKPPARNRLSLTPRGKAPASKALGGSPPVDGDVATVDASATPWDWQAAQAAFAAAECGGPHALLAGPGEQGPSGWGPSPTRRPGYRRTTEFVTPLTRGPGPAASGTAGTRLGTGVPFPGRPNPAYSHAGRDPAHPRGYPTGGPTRRRGACVVCYDPGHWAKQCSIMTPEQQERARHAREADGARGRREATVPQR